MLPVQKKNMMCYNEGKGENCTDIEWDSLQSCYKKMPHL